MSQSDDDLPGPGDAARHTNGESYVLVEADVDLEMENVRTGERYDLLKTDLKSMVESDSWLFRSPTDATVREIDDLAEGVTYRYAGAEPGDRERTFEVDLKWLDDDDFADYGEGAVTLLYQDGYVANVPRSNIEAMIAAHKIERA